MNLKMLMGLGAVGMFTGLVSADTTHVTGSNVLDFKVTPKTTTTSTNAPRKMILLLDRSSSFHSESGQRYVNEIATKIVESMREGDQVAVIGVENTADFLSYSNWHNYHELTNDKQALINTIKQGLWTDFTHDAPAKSAGRDLIGGNPTSSNFNDFLKSLDLVKLFGKGASASDLTVVSLLDDTAVNNRDSSTAVVLQKFINDGGRVLSYIPNVTKGQANVTEETFKGIGVKETDMQKVDYDDNNPGAVADKIVNSITNKTVKTITENSNVNINISSNVLKVKNAILTKPDGSIEKLTGDSVSKNIDNAQSGNYKVTYDFEGDISEHATIIGRVLVNGTEVVRKEDVREPKVSEPTKPVDKPKVKQIEIPYETKIVEDDTMKEGERVVKQKGVVGIREITSESSSGGVLEKTIPYIVKNLVNTETTMVRNPVSFLGIVDVSGSTSLSEMESHGYKGASIRNQQVRDFISIVESLSDDDQFMFGFYSNNQEDTYVIGEQGALMTKMLTKQQALGLLNKLKDRDLVVPHLGLTNETRQTFARELGDLISSEPDGTPFEDAFAKGLKKGNTVSILQMTDFWYTGRPETIDTSFAAWAKANAKTFMSVIDREYTTPGENPNRSEEKMREAGHPNIYIRTAMTPESSAEIVKQFEQTAVETKEVKVEKANVEIEVTTPTGTNLEYAKVTKDGQDVKNITVNGNKGTVTLTNQEDGTYEIHYKAVGEGGEITTNVKINGETVVNKTDSYEKNVVAGSDKIIREPIDEIIHVGTLGTHIVKEIVDDPSVHNFDYEDKMRYGKVRGSTIGQDGRKEITKEYTTIKGVIKGEPKVTERVIDDKVDGDKKLGTQERDVYTESVIEPKKIIYIDDPNLEEGKTRIVTRGQDGLKEKVSTWVTYKGHRFGEPTITEKQIKTRIDQVVKRGTKKKVETVDATEKQTKPTDTNVEKINNANLVKPSTPVSAELKTKAKTVTTGEELSDKIRVLGENNIQKFKELPDEKIKEQVSNNLVHADNSKLTDKEIEKLAPVYKDAVVKTMNKVYNSLANDIANKELNEEYDVVSASLGTSYLPASEEFRKELENEIVKSVEKDDSLKGLDVKLNNEKNVGKVTFVPEKGVTVASANNVEVRDKNGKVITPSSNNKISKSVNKLPETGSVDYTLLAGFLLTFGFVIRKKRFE